MKKRMSSMLVAAMAVTGILCGSLSTAAAAEETVTLKWYGCGNEANGMADKILEKWSEAHPEIQVEYTELSTLWDDDSLKNLDIMIAGGEEFDIVGGINYNLLYPRILNGAVMPLTEAIESSGDDYAEKFGGLSTTMLSYEDEIYGVPMNQTSFKVLYNKTLFEEKGITIPDNWTLEEFTEIAEQLTEDDRYGCVYAPTWSQLTYAPAQVAGWEMVKTDENGEVVPNFDDPLFRSNMEWLYDLTVESDSAPSYAIMKAESLNRRIVFAQKKAAMIVDSEYSLSWLKIYMFDDPGEGALDFEIGVAELPIVSEAGENVQYSQLSSCMWVPRTSNHLEEAYTFIKFVAEETATEAIPVSDSESALTDSVKLFTSYTDSKGEEHTDVYPEEEIRNWVDSSYESHLAHWDYDPALAAYTTVASTVYEEQYSAYFVGDITIDELVKVLNETCEMEFSNIS